MGGASVDETDRKILGLLQGCTERGALRHLL